MLSRRSVKHILSYREAVDESIGRLLMSAQVDAQLEQLVVLGLNHEQQHQELLLTDIKHLFSCNPTKPAVNPSLRQPPRLEQRQLEFVDQQGGIHEIGAEGSDFCFDNELPRHAAHDLLRVMHQEAGSGGALLIGVDLRKDPLILHRAYNDSAGITAEFNLNLLRRLNNEFGADFDLKNFSHRAIWNEAFGRIEMHLVSQRDHEVRIGGRTFHFERDEFLVTEHPHKYSEPEFRKMARRAGFLPARAWTDPRRWFSLFFCTRS